MPRGLEAPRPERAAYLRVALNEYVMVNAPAPTPVLSVLTLYVSVCVPSIVPPLTLAVRVPPFIVISLRTPLKHLKVAVNARHAGAVSEIDAASTVPTY